MTLLLLLCLAPATTALFFSQDVQRGHDVADLMRLPQDAKADFPISLKNVAIGILSGRSENSQVLKNAILTHTQHGFLLRTPGNCMCTFRDGFEKLSKKCPHAKWYYVGDDDAFIHLPNLVKTLSAYDSAKKIIISGQGLYTITDICHKTVPGLDKLFFGGTGQILSAALVHSAEYRSNMEKRCGAFNVNGFGSDAEHTCSLANIWNQDYSHGNLGPISPILKTNLLHAPAFVSVHHLDPPEITTLAHFNQNISKKRRKTMELELPNRQCYNLN